MSDLARQKSLSGEWDLAPIDTCRTQISVAMHAAEDSLLSFADMFSGSHLPMWSYQPVARFGLECMATAFWLSEPPIEASERVRRSINERLRSEQQVRRLRRLGRDPGLERRLLAAAGTLACGVTNSRDGKVLGVAPPSATSRLKMLLGNDLGESYYSYASAVSHGLGWGLMQVVSPDLTLPGPVVPAALVNSTSRVGTAGLGLSLGYLKACERVRLYYGVGEDRWGEVAARAHQTNRDLLAAWQPEAHTDPPT
jgi:hypothetical protein